MQVLSEEYQKELAQGVISVLDKRYQPPVEDTRKVYYRISDILAFLGVENG